MPKAARARAAHPRPLHKEINRTGPCQLGLTGRHGRLSRPSQAQTAGFEFAKKNEAFKFMLRVRGDTSVAKCSWQGVSSAACQALTKGQSLRVWPVLPHAVPSGLRPSHV